MNTSWRRRLLVIALICGVALISGCRRGHPSGDGDGDIDGDIDSDIDGDIGGGDADGDSDGDTDSDSDGDTTLLGRIELFEDEVDLGIYENSATIVFAEIRDHPCGVTHEAYGEECTLNIVEPPICFGSCGAGTSCGWNVACEPLCQPPIAPYQAGTVVINGATHQPRITCPIEPLSGIYTCDLAIDTDIWEASDTLQIVAPGDSFPYFVIEATTPSNVTPLTDLEGITPDRLTGASDLHLEWYPGRDIIEITIDANLAGGAVTLACQTEDDGAFDVPAAGLAALAAEGAASSWTISMARIANADNGVEGDGKVIVTVRGTLRSETIDGV